MFGQFKIVAGDFRTDVKHQYLNQNLMLHEVGGWGLKATKYPTSSVVAVEEVNTDTDRKMGGTVGWGVAGALIAGPLGAVAAGYLGGKTNDVVFICRLDDGKEFVGVMKKSMFASLSAPFLLKKS
ncbi:hypothetical protein ACSSVY_001335 [Roseovarius sp. MBR-51]